MMRNYNNIIVVLLLQTIAVFGQEQHQQHHQPQRHLRRTNGNNYEERVLQTRITTVSQTLLGECDAHCDFDTDCKSGLVCATEDRYEFLKAAGYLKRKAYCAGMKLGHKYKHQVCYNPHKIIPSHNEQLGQECSLDCKAEMDCNAGLVCSEQTKIELLALGYDKRKAYCPLHVGKRLWKVCYNPNRLIDIDNNGGGGTECSLGCTQDGDCQEGLACAFVHQEELAQAGLDESKAYCGNTGSDTLSVCYDPTKIIIILPPPPIFGGDESTLTTTTPGAPPTIGGGMEEPTTTTKVPPTQEVPTTAAAPPTQDDPMTTAVPPTKEDPTTGTPPTQEDPTTAAAAASTTAAPPPTTPTSPATPPQEELLTCSCWDIIDAQDEDAATFGCSFNSLGIINMTPDDGQYYMLSKSTPTDENGDGEDDQQGGPTCNSTNDPISMDMYQLCGTELTELCMGTFEAAMVEPPELARCPCTFSLEGYEGPLTCDMWLEEGQVMSVEYSEGSTAYIGDEYSPWECTDPGAENPYPVRSKDQFDACVKDLYLKCNDLQQVVLLDVPQEEIPQEEIPQEGYEEEMTCSCWEMDNDESYGYEEPNFGCNFNELGIIHMTPNDGEDFFLRMSTNGDPEDDASCGVGNDPISMEMYQVCGTELTEVCMDKFEAAMVDAHELARCPCSFNLGDEYEGPLTCGMWLEEGQVVSVEYSDGGAYPVKPPEDGSDPYSPFECSDPGMVNSYPVRSKDEFDACVKDIYRKCGWLQQVLFG